jgi:hypothetical protein
MGPTLPERERGLEFDVASFLFLMVPSISLALGCELAVMSWVRRFLTRWLPTDFDWALLAEGVGELSGENSRHASPGFKDLASAAFDGDLEATNDSSVSSIIIFDPKDWCALSSAVSNSGVCSIGAAAFLAFSALY